MPMIHEIRFVPPTPESDFAAVAAWLVEVGDHVAAGDDVVEVEAEKSIFSLPAPAAGVLTEVVAAVGDELNAGDLIGVIEAP